MQILNLFLKIKMINDINILYQNSILRDLNILTFEYKPKGF